MFEINPYFFAEVWMKEGDDGRMIFCEEGDCHVALTNAILHLITDGSDWEITKIELTGDSRYDNRHHDQRYEREIHPSNFDQARDFFKAPKQALWIDQYVQKETDGMGQEYDKYQHEVA